MSFTPSPSVTLSSFSTNQRSKKNCQYDFFLAIKNIFIPKKNFEKKNSKKNFIGKNVGYDFLKLTWASYPLGELSVGRVIRWASYPLGEISVGRVIRLPLPKMLTKITDQHADRP